MLIFLISSGQGQLILGTLLAVIGFILNRKAKQIHVLVNSRLDEALNRIADLEKSLGIPKGAKAPLPEDVKTLPEPSDK